MSVIGQLALVRRVVGQREQRARGERKEREREKSDRATRTEIADIKESDRDLNEDFATTENPIDAKQSAF